MRHTALLIVATLAVTACESSQAPTSVPRRTALAPSVDRASGGGGDDEATAREAAWGDGTVTFAATVEDLEFRAHRVTDRDNPFAARGEASFNDRTARVRARIRINCLRVTGNTATLSGIVTESNDRTIRGFEALFQVLDDDLTPGRPVDFASTVLLHAVGTGPDCAVLSEFDLAPFKGYVEVQPEIGS